MVDLIEFKRLLGPSADSMSDEEVKHIRDSAYLFADAIFDSWLLKRNAYAQGPIALAPV